MDFSKIVQLTIVVFVLGSASLAFGGTPFFTGLGDLPGGLNFSSIAYGPRSISADGTIVVGYSSSGSGTEAFRWENGVINGMGDFPGGALDSAAFNMSADGSVVVGRGHHELGYEAARWTQWGGMQGLGDLPGGDYYSRAMGTSYDGTVIVGDSESASGLQAFKWTQETGMVGLGDLEGGGFRSLAWAASEDGSVIVGTGESENGTEAFRWENGVMTGLGDLPGGGFRSIALNVSADGSVVIGQAQRGEELDEAYRWKDGVMVGLGDLPGGVVESTPFGMTPDGSIIVGSGFTESGFEAFIWDETNGMRNLNDIMANDYGLDITGWTALCARSISADGLTIAGVGTNPQGFQEGWIAHIPEPNTLSILVVGAVMLTNRKRRPHLAV